MSRRTNPQRTAEMRARLLAAARELFATAGYAAAATPAIVAAAGVTRGALYHHFEDKRAIFEAVIEVEAQAVGQAIADAEVPGTPAVEQLVAGSVAYLEAMSVPGRARLMLIEGPAVLGRDGMREIETRHGESMLRIGVEEAIAETGLDLPAAVISSLLSALFERAALDMSDGADADDVQQATRAVISGLFGAPNPNVSRSSSRLE